MNSMNAYRPAYAVDQSHMSGLDGRQLQMSVMSGCGNNSIWGGPGNMSSI